MQSLSSLVVGMAIDAVCIGLFVLFILMSAALYIGG